MTKTKTKIEERTSDEIVYNTYQCFISGKLSVMEDCYGRYIVLREDGFHPSLHYLIGYFNETLR